MLYSVIGIDDDSEQQHACATNSAHEAAAEEQDSLLAQLQAATARIHALQCQLSDVQEVQKQQQLKEAALAAQLAHAQQALQQQQHATEAAKAQLESALAASPLLADTHFLQQQLAAANARAEELEMQLMSGSASREALRQELLKELAATQAQAKETLQGLAQETEALRAKVSASPLLLLIGWYAGWEKGRNIVFDFSNHRISLKQTPAVLFYYKFRKQVYLVYPVSVIPNLFRWRTCMLALPKTSSTQQSYEPKQMPCRPSSFRKTRKWLLSALMQEGCQNKLHSRQPSCKKPWQLLSKRSCGTGRMQSQLVQHVMRCQLRQPLCKKPWQLLSMRVQVRLLSCKRHCSSKARSPRKSLLVLSGRPISLLQKGSRCKNR